MFAMELVLNLCWLSLLLPAYLLWRQRTSSNGSSCPAGKPVASLVFACVIGCALVLLFPVISASDDLHSMRPEMEESETAFRHAGHCAPATHAVAHCSQLLVTTSVSARPDLAQIGTVASSLLQTHPSFFVPAPAGRAPPLQSQTAL
jgi:hypothetical protein